jgi:mannose-6-phosphate isomerase-like protein (cupin superfamily)
MHERKEREMLPTRCPVFVPSGTGTAAPTPWLEALVEKIDGSSTGGAFSVTELSVDRDWSRPPYVHHVLDEAFYVVSGSVHATVETAEDPLELAAGSLLFVPRGVLRSLRAAGEPAVLLIVTTPGLPASTTDPAEGIEFAERFAATRL